MDIENANSNIMVKTPGKTPNKGVNKSAKKSMTTPRANTLNSSSAKLLFGTPSTPFSPNSSMSSTSSNGSTTRELARIAKLQSTAERVRKTAMLKEKWAKEKEEKAERNRLKRQEEIQKLNETSQLLTELRRRNIEKQREIENQKKEEEKLQLQTSLEARTQLAIDLEKEKRAKRRISIFINNKIKQMATKKQQEMESMKKEEELDFLSTKRLDFLALREEKRIEDIKKRESLANRTKLAQEQKKIVEDLLSKKKEEENSLLECRHLNWKDDQEFVKQQEMRKRESLAFRLDEWRKHKQADESAEREEMQQREEAMQTRYEEWKDIQNYKQELTKNARESLCWRLNKWRNERSHEQQQELERLEALEIERELQRQELEDIKAYKQSLKEARKQSLAFRLNEARKHKDWETGLLALEQEVRDEERRLKDLDREAVEDYKQRMLDERRRSLEYRNQTEYQDKLRRDGELAARKEEENLDRMLKTQEWREIKKQQQEERNEQRKSIAKRLAESNRQQELSLAKHRETLDALHLDLELKRIGNEDVKIAKKAEEDRSRQSLQMRLESYRIQDMAELKYHQKKAAIQEEEKFATLQDRDAIVQAKKEIDEIALRKELAKTFVL